jgi:hypothetical protein
MSYTPTGERLGALEDWYQNSFTEPIPKIANWYQNSHKSRSQNSFVKPLWLNAGVPAPEVARRAGHGVDVLLRVYAKCIDGQEESVNRRIDDALVA